MIAPIRTSPDVAVSTSPGLQHVGQLLPQILARYGIVMTAAELAAFCPTMKKNISSEKAASPKQMTFRPRTKVSARQSHRQPTERTTTAHRRKVQLPLFPSTQHTTSSGLAVR
jgi:hypothetical protein